MYTTIPQLKAAHAAAQAEHPKMRIRDLARVLSTSEAQLVALQDGTVTLAGNFKAMLAEAHTLGRVMALTRNDDAVHERKGVYDNVSFEGGMGLAVNPDIDLRLFMMHWQYGFAVSEGGRQSLQFFDKSGEAVHKIYLLEESNAAAYESLVGRFRSDAPQSLLATESYPSPPAETPDAAVDADGFRAAWLALEDTHHFFGLLKKYGLTRTQALRLAPEGHATEVPADAVRRALEAAAAAALPVMAFVSSRGCIQIHTGPVEKLLQTGPWFNVLDEAFNLHLRETAIASVYVVKKPSVDGIVTSLEVFDAGGSMIIQLFGARKPGQPELPGWRDIVARLLPEALPA